MLAASLSAKRLRKRRPAAAIRALSASSMAAAILSACLEELERVRPLVAQEAWNAPEHAQRLDCPRGLDLAHVGGFPPELIQDRFDGLLCASSLPQINSVGFPPWNRGFTMRALPTELNAFTKRAAGNSRCNCSISDSSRVVKNCSTPWLGGASAMGLVASMTGLPARLDDPAPCSASAEAAPLTARTTTAPNWAASLKLPTRARGFSAAQAFSFAGSRVPITTS